MGLLLVLAKDRHGGNSVVEQAAAEIPAPEQATAPATPCRDADLAEGLLEDHELLVRAHQHGLVGPGPSGGVGITDPTRDRSRLRDLVVVDGHRGEWPVAPVRAPLKDPTVGFVQKPYTLKQLQQALAES